MDVEGRMEVTPGPDWNQIRLQSVSTDDMRGVLDHVKQEQRTNAVVDTLAALVYDVNATAEVLRKGSLKRKKKPEVEVEYKLRITPQPWEEAQAMPFPSPRQVETPTEDVYTLDRVSSEYGVNIEDTTTSSSKRARSETPRRLIQIEGTPPPSDLPICAFCNEYVEGPCITALAPNSYRAQKFHPHHFVCTYCQKALNLRGTYREHERKPYCHECFYRLYSGLIYAPDEKQKIIQKLI
uniref:LIM zinc-binding domain-containing protein n=2 Tax=Plectus sambesii TaxID=2011161 RepID=A0A914WXG4_9BILA